MKNDNETILNAEKMNIFETEIITTNQQILTLLFAD